MMSSSSSNNKQEGPKLFSSRILSRDRSSVANASFRVYYSLGAGTVPFLWESKPGTPKSSATPAALATAGARTTTVPPISPPPSYQQSAVSQSSKAKTKFRRRPVSSWPPGSWIIGWLRRSPPSSPPSDHQRQRCLARRDDHGVVDGDDRQSRRSSLCF
ncbi:uncharacterized protein LOC8069128 [Sorghum bicolor]|uniref:Uncharacterized protein n=1 Tax=Sorghum bicolor TaxID=4558 RepID=C5XDH4_SORBI|nr:uncharacterized protein LOC8069128 [Sorghum bicolor]EER96097.1 hypothetical protein SORBI_3002G082300 [Sorghum bicolor]|eukprot:XP_002459576.1 uncharacterized protein LOC8069128 [Sorghum bicolor]